ncbi:MAG: hypothetical protein MHM6MM_004369 [Cercozoa sp. M6MM]
MGVSLLHESGHRRAFTDVLHNSDLWLAQQYRITAIGKCSEESLRAVRAEHSKVLQASLRRFTQEMEALKREQHEQHSAHAVRRQAFASAMRFLCTNSKAAAKLRQTESVRVTLAVATALKRSNAMAKRRIESMKGGAVNDASQTPSFKTQTASLTPSMPRQQRESFGASPSQQYSSSGRSSFAGSLRKLRERWQDRPPFDPRRDHVTPPPAEIPSLSPLVTPNLTPRDDLAVPTHPVSVSGATERQLSSLEAEVQRLRHKDLLSPINEISTTASMSSECSRRDRRPSYGVAMHESDRHPRISPRAKTPPSSRSSYYFSAADVREQHLREDADLLLSDPAVEVVDRLIRSGSQRSQGTQSQESASPPTSAAPLPPQRRRSRPTWMDRAEQIQRR